MILGPKWQSEAHLGHPRKLRLSVSLTSATERPPPRHQGVYLNPTLDFACVYSAPEEGWTWGDNGRKASSILFILFIFIFMKI